MVAGDLREGLNRLPLVLLLAAFCLPLFVGLGRVELENDEAIYSYAVESILATGEWASPRSSPSPDIVFLEKPPLKFWIVAAPIRLGLLPLDEFGLRFWDAVFGAAAFVYVFLIGQRLAGPVCGAVALLILSAHGPLLFEHGLRGNNMEAPLFLAYSGGVYHYLSWRAGGGRRGGDIAAFSALFFLGFMTKFVAALFLPVVAGASALLLPADRRRFLQDWRGWSMAALIVAAAILPWFVYQHVRDGESLWRVMFGEHVYARFTEYADPRHVQPWHFYATETWRQLARSGSAAVTALGLGGLIVHTVRRRRPEGAVILVWLVVPAVLMSLGSSKLYHYFYPYLPPLALAGGFGVACVVAWIGRFGARRAPWVAKATMPRRRRILLPLACAAWALAFATAIQPISLRLGGHTVFSNRSVARPLVAGLGFALLAGQAPLALGGAVALGATLLFPTPLEAYGANLRRLTETRQPLKQLGACLRGVDAARHARGEDVRAPYAPVSDEAFLHPYFYYLRGTGWLDEQPDDERLRRALFSPGHEQPVVIDAVRYAAFLDRVDAGEALPIGISRPGIVVLLPGEYRACRYAMGRQPQ